MATTPQYDFHVNLDDLAFILEQIKIAEASTTPDGQVENLAALVGSPLLPYGLRTVDGSWNNIEPGKELLGATDTIMPRLVDPSFRTAEAAPGGVPNPGDPPGIQPTTYADLVPGNVVYDSQPRVISNMVIDQTATNPAAVIAAFERAQETAFPGLQNVQVTNGTLLIPNLPPDGSGSPPYNGLLGQFGQFFDHGLDFITKGGGTIYIPLHPDDPAYVEGSNTNYIVLSRAENTRTAGADGILGNADDVYVPAHTSTITSTIDQNQTYTSDPSHQVFLREYIVVDGKPQDTGHLLSGAYGIASWGEVKAQAAHVLGIQLIEEDVLDVPLLATDPYGDFIRGEHGRVQFVTMTGLVEADPPGGAGALVPANAIRTHHAFLSEIAPSATPGLVEDGQPVPYDHDLLDRHFITGDGRGNQNIGLTAIHSVFHSEHNRLVDSYKATLLASGDLDALNEWLLTPLPAGSSFPTTQDQIDHLNWNGERLFQAGRFVTEMEYQHLAVEEFARRVQPGIHAFEAYSPDVPPAVLEEFAEAVFRFGHSLFTETLARLGANLQDKSIDLTEAFLNPEAFNAGSISGNTAVADIVRGMSRQVGNEIDEFITEALRNNLTSGGPDLAAVDVARERDTGLPTLQQARAAFFAATGDSHLTPYTSWSDFGQHLLNSASLVNFIAAYGDHPTILAADTLADKRAAALLLVQGGAGAPDDRMDFLNASGPWTAANSGLNVVDFFAGGLAEAKLDTGGLLGPTFNYVFQLQIEQLQDGDRFYYLSRLPGTNMFNEIEADSFATLFMRNSDLGERGNTTHVPDPLFSAPSYTLEMDPADQRTGIIGPDGVGLNGDPTRDHPFLQAFSPLVIRMAPHLDNDGDGIADDGGVLVYAPDGTDHVVLGGTPGDDVLVSGRGDDTLWGDEGNDRLDAGEGGDHVHGGDGDDIIIDQDTSTDGDTLLGENGNDVIVTNGGNDTALGGAGSDFIRGGKGTSEVLAGTGDDFVLGGAGAEDLFGNEGDDWIEGGSGPDELTGDNEELHFERPIKGNDVLGAQGDGVKYVGHDGNDIMVLGKGQQACDGGAGFDWASNKGNPVPAHVDLGNTVAAQGDTFVSVEAVSGWKFNDVLAGSSCLPAGDGSGSNNLLAGDVAQIAGLVALLGLTDEAVARMAADACVFDTRKGAELIIGGAGSDTITGNLGNDILDGDAWLNTRIRVTHGVDDANTAANEWFSVNSLQDIAGRLISGEINPGQLHIVREILQSDTAATDVDTAVYHGAVGDYTLTELPDGAFRVAQDQVRADAPDDGTDIVRHFEQLQFSDKTLSLVEVAPEFTSFGGADTAQVSLSENTTAITTLQASDGNIGGSFALHGQSLRFAIIGGADAARFVLDRQTGALSFASAPDFEHPLDMGRDNVYNVNIGVTDGTSWDRQSLVIKVGNVDEAATGSVRLASYTTTDAAATLVASSTVVDDDVGTSVLDPHWQRLVGGRWVDLGGGATLANQSSTTVRAVVTYTDAFGSHTVASDETVIIGSCGNDTLVGSSGKEILLGLGGDDVLTGNGGDDTLDGGSGNDTFRATVNDGNDEFIGGSGIDTYTLVSTSSGATVNLTAGTSSSAQTGSDILSGIENVVGSTGADTITDGAGANQLAGGGGDDVFIMTNDNARDIVEGGAGSDTVDYSASMANLRVTLGNGAVVGGSGSSVGKSDVISFIANFIGGSGNDVITGDAQANRLVGGGGNDTLNGMAGNDDLDGGAGNDMLSGGDGNDVLHGGLGSDQLNGGRGSDTFTFASLAESPDGRGERDVVADFVRGTDKLDLSPIDANTLVPGNQAFTFSPVSGDGFSGPGELRYLLESRAPIVSLMQASVEGNHLPEMQVELVGVTTLAVQDIVL